MRPSEMSFFEEHGYLIVRNLLTAPQVAGAATALRRVLAGDREGVRSVSTVRRADGTYATQYQQIYRAQPGLLELARDPRLGTIAAALMATAEVRLWHDQTIYKPAREGATVSWHQDYAAWRHVFPATMVTAWIAITQSNVSNGCVWVVPGSHRLGLLGAGARPGRDEDPESLLEELALRRPGQLLRVPLELHPGDVTFHHCLLLHGSYQNRSDGDRLGYVLHFLPAEARYIRRLDRTGEHEVQVADGELIRGDGFPLLWPVAGA